MKHRGLRLCLQCRKMWFKIGLPVYPKDPKSPRVCSKDCVKKWRAEAREEAAWERWEEEQAAVALEKGNMP